MFHLSFLLSLFRFPFSIDIHRQPNIQIRDQQGLLRKTLNNEKQNALSLPKSIT